MSYDSSIATARRLAGLVLFVAFSVSVLPAGAQVTPFFGITGPLSVSVDGAGSIEGVHTIDVDKPSDSALVVVAFLFAASTSRQTMDGDVVLNDVPVVWTGGFGHFVPGTQTVFFNTAAEVTEIVAPVLDAAPAGRVSFDLFEVVSETIEGEILAVVFEDPDQPVTRTIWMAFGGSNAFVDDYTLSFLRPIDPNEPGAVADFGIGISSSPQSEPDLAPAGRVVQVGAALLSSAAGGEDDGENAFGARITVGGLADSNDNPPDPAALPNGDPRLDDELYSLLPFLSPDAERLRVTTFTESPFENFFFAYFVLSEFGVVNEGILLRPEESVNEVGTEHTVTATVVDDGGLPVPGVTVLFEVTFGPNAGESGSGTTDDVGAASFTYTGDGGEGFDRIVARFFNDEQNEVFSNVVSKKWVISPDIVLSPASASHLVGARHTVTASVTDPSGLPQAGIEVTFEVVSGVNAGTASRSTTDGDGEALFTYAGVAGAGLDEIEASFVDDLGMTRTSDRVTAEWLAPILSDPRPDVAVSASGSILVARESGTGLTEIATALLDSAGDVLARDVLSSATTSDASPAVAALAGGGFVVVYLRGRPLTHAVLAGFVGEDGLITGDEVVIEDTDEVCDLDTARECPLADPDVAALAGGGFVAVWVRDGTVFGRIFNGSGMPLAGVFPVTPEGASHETPEVAALPDGSFAVAYRKVVRGSVQVRLARFDASGTLTADVRANRFVSGSPAEPAVAVAPPGNAPVVLWESMSEATGAGIFGRVDPEKARQPEFQVNSRIEGDQLGAALAVQPNGLLAAVWLDAARGALAAQRFTSELIFVGGEVDVTPGAFLGSTGTTVVLGRPRAASLPDGSLAVVSGIAGDDSDPDGGAALAFVGPSRFAACFEDGRLVADTERLACVKLRHQKRLRPRLALRESRVR